MEIFIGTAGAAVILILFLLNEMHYLDQDNIWYDAGNIAGSGLLLAYAYLLGSVPFMILNGIWALFSLKDVAVALLKKK